MGENVLDSVVFFSDFSVDLRIISQIILTN